MNLLCGVYKLIGIENVLVVDIGGIIFDIGVLQNGFFCEFGQVVDIGGVCINFCMFDVCVVGLGGGSIVFVDGK